MANDWKWLDDVVEEMRDDVERNGWEPVLTAYEEKRALVNECAVTTVDEFVARFGPPRDYFN